MCQNWQKARERKLKKESTWSRCQQPWGNPQETNNLHGLTNTSNSLERKWIHQNLQGPLPFVATINQSREINPVCSGVPWIGGEYKINQNNIESLLITTALRTRTLILRADWAEWSLNTCKILSVMQCVVDKSKCGHLCPNRPAGHQISNGPAPVQSQRDASSQKCSFFSLIFQSLAHRHLSLSAPCQASDPKYRIQTS